MYSLHVAMCYNFIILAGLLAIIELPDATTATIIHVNSENGDDSHCLPPGSASVACRTLQHVASSYQGQSNLDIVIEADMQLQGTIKFEGVANVSIAGDGCSRSQDSIKKQIFHLNQSTVLLISVINFTICNLEFTSFAAPEYTYL